MVPVPVVARTEGLVDDEVLATPSEPPLLSGEPDPPATTSENTAEPARATSA